MLRAVSMSLIFGRTSRRTLPSPSTIGTKSSWVPYFLYSTVTVPRLCGTSVGTLPPTWK